MKQKIDYLEAFKELEKIVEEIETGEIGVDVLSEKVKRATELIKICKSKLRETEGEVEKVLEELEGEG